MDDYDGANDEDDNCYGDEDNKGNTDDDDDDDNDSNVNTDREEEDENYDRDQYEEPLFNNILGEYDWKLIRDSDNESVASLAQH